MLQVSIRCYKLLYDDTSDAYDYFAAFAKTYDCVGPRIIIKTLHLLFCLVFPPPTGCHKQVCAKLNTAPKVNRDVFTEVKGRNNAKKSGVQVANQKLKFAYRPLDYKKMVGARPSTVKGRDPLKIQVQNSFSVLDSDNVKDGGDLGIYQREG
ncbi:hypothetical protein QVD17_07196 [Tagetes erecta]|uniref:Uncharacterized protein n=1 Tax=Tagetes erecta TaxID=13708 RepID=A0AAD8PBX7_TARER|nr:hypothetical protein QVD17_07196 [Tagetes erecta]